MQSSASTSRQQACWFTGFMDDLHHGALLLRAERHDMERTHGIGVTQGLPTVLTRHCTASVVRDGLQPIARV